MPRISFNQPLNFVAQSSLQSNQDSPGESGESFISMAHEMVSEINRQVKRTNEIKRLSFPAWSFGTSKESFTGSIYKYLLTVGGRIIYRLYTEGRYPVGLEPQTLATFFEEVVHEKASRFINNGYDDGGSGKRSTELSYDDVSRISRNAARRILENNTMESCEKHRREQARKGRLGGLQGRRRATFTPDMLQPQGDRSKTAWVRAEMERLGAGERTVWNLIKATDTRQSEADQLAEIDALLAPREVIRRAPRVDHELAQMEHEILVAELVDTLDSAMADFEEHQAKLSRHEALGEARWNADLESGWLDQVLAA